LGYYSDLWKQIQEEEQQKLAPPPRAPEPRGWLDSLRDASRTWQEHANLKALAEMDPSQVPSTFPLPGVGPAAPYLTNLLAKAAEPVARGVSKGVAALPAAAGAGFGGYFKPPMLRSNVENLPLEEKVKALKEGVKAGGEVLPTTITPLDIAGFTPGKVGMAANLADALFGVGDVAGGVEEKDPAQIAMGAARVTGNLAGVRGEHLRIKSLKLQDALKRAATEQAAVKKAAQPVGTGGEESFFKSTQLAPELNLEVAPQVTDALRIGARRALTEINQLRAQAGQPSPPPCYRSPNPHPRRSCGFRGHPLHHPRRPSLSTLC
jgi:hypothetical protein